MRGRFIAFEGIDGSGKSTALASTAAALSDELDIWTTREETDMWTGAAVRRAIDEHAEPLTTAFLFLADRAGHVPKIRAHIDAGTHVLCDRFHHSTLAYQSVTLHGTMDDPVGFLRRLHAPLRLAPDHVLLFDLEPALALERVLGRGVATPYEKQAFLSDVRQAYLGLAKDEPDRFTIIDASKSPADVATDAVAAVRAALA